MKYVLWIIVAAAIIGGGTYLYSREKAGTANAATIQQTAQVARRNLEKVISANGKVVSNQDIDIKCRASGEITDMPYDVNAEVAPDAVLLKLDEKEQQRVVTSAEAQLTSDQARLEDSRLSWEVAKLKLETSKQRVQASLQSAKAKLQDATAKGQRIQELFNNKLASKEELETAQTAVLQADATLQTENAALAEIDQQAMEVKSFEYQIKQLEQTIKQNTDKLQTAKDNVGYCTVRAPIADNPVDPPKWRVKTITTNVRKGYIVQSGTSGTGGGTIVMTLADLSHIFVLASVPESDIGDIAPGQPVRITADAFQNVTFEGQVVRVATAGVTTNNVVTFEVKIEVTSENRALLRPEMTTTTNVVVASRENALVVPVGAFSRMSRAQALAAAGTTTAPDASGTTTATAPAPAAPQQAPDAAAPGRGGRGGGGRGGRGGNGGAGRRGGGGAPVGNQGQLNGTVQVLKEGATTPEPRSVTVGLTDGEYYEIVSGDVAENDTVIVNSGASDSRWRGGNNQGGGGGGGGGLVPRGFGGGGGGGGGRGR